MANDVNLNSNAWTDIIFEDKNKEYGTAIEHVAGGARAEERGHAVLLGDSADQG